MLKIDQATMQRLEQSYPGISEQITDFEKRDLPHCPNCRSSDTAAVQRGIIGRTMNLAAATTKCHLIPNGPKPGKYFCNACANYFG